MSVYIFYHEFSLMIAFTNIYAKANKMAKTCSNCMILHTFGHVFRKPMPFLDFQDFQEPCCIWPTWTQHVVPHLTALSAVGSASPCYVDNFQVTNLSPTHIELIFHTYWPDIDISHMKFCTFVSKFTLISWLSPLAFFRKWIVGAHSAIRDTCWR